MNPKTDCGTPGISVTSKDGTVLTLEEHLKATQGTTPDQIHVVRMDEIKAKSFSKNHGRIHYDNDTKQHSLDESGYVRTYSRKEILMENIVRIRKENLEKYGKRIEDHIIDQVLAFIGRDKSKPARFHQQKTVCVLLALTMGPVNVIELTNKLNQPIKHRIDPSVFQFEKDDVSSIMYRLSSADPKKSWMRKYLIIHRTESRMARYELPPPIMLTAAMNPSHLLEGFSTLDIGFKEEDLLNQLPILEEMVEFDDLSDPVSESSEEDLSIYQEHFKAIRNQYTDWWKGADNITLTDIAVGFLMQGKFYSIKQLTEDMLEWAIDMHKRYPKITKKVNKITGLSQTINTWLQKDYPIHQFIETRKKAKRYNEYRIRPELSKLLWRDVLCLKKKGNTDKLKQLCHANDWLNEIVNPSEEETLSESPKKEQPVKDDLKSESVRKESLKSSHDISDVLKNIGDILKGGPLRDILDNGINIHISFGNSNNSDSKMDDINAKLDAISQEIAEIAKVWK